MTDNRHAYSQGDWIVHRYYGIGQVKGIDRKHISGKMAECYRVKTQDSVFWVPVEKIDVCRVRPLSSPSDIRKASKILGKPPQEMKPDYKQRQYRIKDVRSDGSLMSICRLIRDLSAMQVEKSISQNESRALDVFEKRLLVEWSVSADVTVEDAGRQLRDLLEKGQAQVCAMD
jgi:RNA polymerase-interacting CarD/CdnL/TRCF family regulator